jgi:3-hydroxyacyl-[acyl-carrier-protein] dehydratase
VTGDRAVVEAVIPHRDPMLFVDRVSEVEEGVRLAAHRVVTGREPWYPAGSAGMPALCPPGLLLESWAQAAVLLTRWADPNPDARTGEVELLTMFRRASVLRSVPPGTELVHEVRLDKVTGGAAVTAGGATADGSPVLEIGMCVIARRAARDL